MESINPAKVIKDHLIIALFLDITFYSCLLKSEALAGQILSK